MVDELLEFNVKTETLIIIELKPARAITELKRQLQNTEELIKSEATCFLTLLKTGGFDWAEPLEVEKIAIWPVAQTLRPKMFPKDIGEFCYTKMDDVCRVEFSES